MHLFDGIQVEVNQLGHSPLSNEIFHRKLVNHLPKHHDLITLNEEKDKENCIFFEDNLKNRQK